MSHTHHLSIEIPKKINKQFKKDSNNRSSYHSFNQNIRNPPERLYSASFTADSFISFPLHVHSSTSIDKKIDNQSQQTDRFIPSRKLLKKDYLSVSEEQTIKLSKNNNNNIDILPEIYRKYVMFDRVKQGKQKNGDTFQNSNLFKYNLKPSSHSIEEQVPAKGLSQQFTEQLSNFKNNKRKINKLPIKVLDAPALQDDYYLNLIDWSVENFLAVGLSSSVYLWNASNSKVTKLCDLGNSNMATSVSCSLKSSVIALGTNSGQVQIWDINKVKKIRQMSGHTLRIGAMAWNSSILSTGSRDKTILHRDIRSNSPYISRLTGHKQQICGLKWSFDDQQLCSGGNDNKLMVWNNHSCEPILKYSDHVAAVKAMAWSPHQHGLLVSGGGTADRTIKFRNTHTGTTLESYDVGSQVCNLLFSKSLNELVSTHGYSQNQINIWKCPEMQKVATLTGHTYRVLYLAMNPDGSTIVTGAGDETLRFWNIFPSKNESGKSTTTILNMDSVMLR